ncbi:hypothetical protein ACFO6R_16075 [Eubacterium multiforme]|uniref:Uncharacterized protein n=1 Tax=Eubacterium multiforme TaxID=83339 RepID=A0ABT9UTI0_9FIRM|nr:hypothetical protein [Eubacterium multiforme]MDQ0149620.1 hypothetical protein [Eubacterium multiforme]
MAVKKTKEDSFYKKLVLKILEMKGVSYEDWLEEQHKEFLDNKENQQQILKGLDTLEEIGGE